jgi:MFS family permease
MTATTAIAESGLRRLLPMTATVFLGLMTMGIPLSVLPLQLHDALGFDMVTVGWVMGIESAATLLTRRFAGRTTDRRGPKAAMLIGLVASALSGAAYLLALLPGLGAGATLAILVLGRVAMGVGEGLLFTAGSAWPIGMLGMAQAGKALSWIGIAMFGGIAAGMALGSVLQQGLGFAAAAAAALVVPLLGFAIALAVPAVRLAPQPGTLPFRRILRLILPSGAGFALAMVGFAAIGSFLVLAYDAQGWAGGGVALTLFGAGFVAARLLFGGRSDRASGPGTVIATLAVEAAGLLLLAWMPGPWAGMAGAAITGFGLSMVYPLLALPAIRRIPPGDLGTAIGTYDAGADVAIMAGTPICGALAAGFGFQAVFLFAAGTAMLATGLAVAAYRAR